MHSINLTSLGKHIPLFPSDVEKNIYGFLKIKELYRLSCTSRLQQNHVRCFVLEQSAILTASTKKALMNYLSLNVEDSKSYICKIAPLFDEFCLKESDQDFNYLTTVKVQLLALQLKLFHQFQDLPLKSLGCLSQELKKIEFSGFFQQIFDVDQFVAKIYQQAFQKAAKEQFFEKGDILPKQQALFILQILHRLKDDAETATWVDQIVTYIHLLKYQDLSCQSKMLHWILDTAFAKLDLKPAFKIAHAILYSSLATPYERQSGFIQIARTALFFENPEVALDAVKSANFDQNHFAQKGWTLLPDIAYCITDLDQLNLFYDVMTTLDRSYLSTEIIDEIRPLLKIKKELLRSCKHPFQKTIFPT
jgi:hypothetical protein